MDRDTCWHVSSNVNRASIKAHGLDWRRMGVTGGIAMGDGAPRGSTYCPEAEAVFLCESLGEAEWFATFGQHPLVDIWEVDARELPLEDWPDGWLICRQPIPASRIRLVRQDIPPPVPEVGDPQHDAHAFSTVVMKDAMHRRPS